ncbi:hypothetical protein P154DRAFT_574203 [Amniculicola lignicola CBS 123094]|uniref:Uncharacterized protein n=1 Tax=Amniculicola lignicola CBS 123094 TaxID=1392246 RepID=A0A6A5WT61_9PLEO|nr:hypothetical protein P154DRAFT_574203 [Amniculicola lignicola CBS 123094]
MDEVATTEGLLLGDSTGENTYDQSAAPDFFLDEEIKRREEELRKTLVKQHVLKKLRVHILSSRRVLLTKTFFSHEVVHDLNMPILALQKQIKNVRGLQGLQKMLLENDSRKFEVESNITALANAWAKSFSLGFAAAFHHKMPQEIRDMVYEYLFHTNFSESDYSENGPTKTPYVRYYSEPEFVGEDFAREFVRYYYEHREFEYEHDTEFVMEPEQDLYGLGVIPRDHIRNVIIDVDASLFGVWEIYSSCFEPLRSLRSPHLRIIFNILLNNDEGEDSEEVLNDRFLAAMRFLTSIPQRDRINLLLSSFIPLHFPTPFDLCKSFEHGMTRKWWYTLPGAALGRSFIVEMSNGNWNDSVRFDSFEA